jgi:hypothetical protein
MRSTPAPTTAIAIGTNQSFLLTSMPALPDGHACNASVVSWPEKVETVSPLLVCGPSFSLPPLVLARPPGELFKPAELDPESDGNEVHSSFDGVLSTNGFSLPLAVFTRVFTANGDTLTVRLQSPPRARRLATPTYFFLSAYTAPNLTFYFSAMGTVPRILYDAASVQKRQLVIKQLDAGVLFTDLTVTTEDFDWVRGDNVTRTAVGVVALIDPTRATAGTGDSVVNVSLDYAGGGTNSIIIGVIFIFIGVACSPCIGIYLFACCLGLCCGRERGRKFMTAVGTTLRKGGAYTDDDAGDAPARQEASRFRRCFAWADKSTAILCAMASVSSALFTIVQLVAMIFSITLIQQGIGFLKALIPELVIPELQALAAALLAEWNVNIAPLIDAFRAVTSFFNIAVLAVSEACYSPANILAAALCAFVLYFMLLVIRLDLFVRVKHFGVSSPLFEVVGKALLTLLTLTLQTLLQQMNLQINRAVGGEITEFDDETDGCTDLDVSIAPFTRVATIVFIALASVAIAVAFLFPKQREVLEKSGEGVRKLLFLLLGGLFVVTTTMLGVWTAFAIQYTALAARAMSGLRFFKALSAGDAFSETMDTVSRLNGLFFVLLFPPLILLSKVGEAAAEAPIWVADDKIRAEIDAGWKRIFIWLTNMASLGLQVLAAVTANANAVVGAAALIVFREMVIKLISKIIAIVTKKPPAPVGAIEGGSGEAPAATEMQSAQAQELEEVVVVVVDPKPVEVEEKVDPKPVEVEEKVEVEVQPEVVEPEAPAPDLEPEPEPERESESESESEPEPEPQPEPNESSTHEEN